MAPGRAGGILRARGRGNGSVRDGKAPDRGGRHGRVTPPPASLQSSNGQQSNRAQPRPSRGSYQPPKARKPAARGTANSQNGTRTPPESAWASAVAGTSFQQRYELLKKSREQERKKAIAEGFLADPDNPRTLAEAITPVGTCEDMCAEFERVERIIQNDVWKQEVDPKLSINGTTRVVDEKRMVKKFRRAAAGIDEQLPSDLRPPKALHRTVDYLFNDLLGDVNSLHDAHHFIWDRTRAIRNDFSIQQLRKPSDLRIAIECYERIARFHILCLHQFALPENRYDSYDQFQEREQLDRTILSLMQYYDDCRGRIQCPNEAEFRAYCIIFQIQQRIPDLEDRGQTWPKQVVQDPRVQTALQVYAAACNTKDSQGPLRPQASHPLAQENWDRFWQLIESQKVSYLMCCVAELYFGLVRRTALNSIWQAYRRGSSKKTEEWSLEDLVEVFGFDNRDQVNDFLEAFGFSVFEDPNGTPYVDLGSISGKELPDPPSNIDKQTWSYRLVEAKRHNRTLSAIINGLSVRAAKEAGRIERSGQDKLPAPKQPNDSLFVTDHSEEEDVPNIEAKSKAKSLAENAQPKLNPFAANFAPSPTAPLTGSTALPTTEQTAPFLGKFGQPGPSNHPFNHVRNEAISQPPTKNTSLPPEHAMPTTKSLVFGEQAPLAQQQPTGGSTTPKSVGFFTASQSNNSKSSPFTSQQKTLPNPFAPSVSTPKHPSTSTPTAPASKSHSQHPSTHHPPESSIFQFGTTLPSGTSSFVQARTGSDAVLFSKKSPEIDLGNQPFTFKANDTHRYHSPSSSILDMQSPSTFNPLPSQISSNIRPNSSTFPIDKSLLAGNPTATQAPVSISNLPNPVVSSQASTTLPSSDTPLFTFGRPENTGSGQNAAKIHGKSVPPRRSSEIGFPSSASTPGSSDQIFPKTATVQESRPPIQDNSAKQSIVMHSFAQNMVLESYGFLEQFVEFIVGPIIRECLQQHESETVEQEADEFRQLVLAHRWSARWRDICWNRRLKRQGRERRQRLARDMRVKATSRRESSAESQMQSFFSSLDSENQSPPSRTQSTRDRRKPRPNGKSLPPTPGVDQATMRERTGSIQQPTSGPVSGPRPSSAERERQLTTQTPSQGPSKPYSSVLSGRSSFLGSSFLAGDSLLRQSVLGAGGQVDRTRSSYFKLKAMGLEPGGPISMETSRKRAREEEEEESEGVSPGKPAFSPPEKKLYQANTNLVNGVSPKESRDSRTSTNEEDEALFAQMRVARQAMSESISFFKEEIAKEEVSGKGTSDAGTSESPRASQRPRNPPAYWNRESKFVPREMYGKGSAKAKGKWREGRPNGIGAPSSQQHAAGSWGSFSQQPPTGFLGSFVASPPTPPAQEQPKGGTSTEDAIEL